MHAQANGRVGAPAPRLGLGRGGALPVVETHDERPHILAGVPTDPEVDPVTGLHLARTVDGHRTGASAHRTGASAQGERGVSSSQRDDDAGPGPNAASEGDPATVIASPVV